MGRKKVHEGEQRQYGFRMPARTFALLTWVAQERGTDVAAVLNGIIAEAVPDLKLWLGQRIFSRATLALRDRMIAAVVPDEHRRSVVAICAKLDKLLGEHVPSEHWRTAGAPLAEQEAPGNPALQARLVEWVVMIEAVRETAEGLLQEQVEEETDGGTEVRSGGATEAKEEPGEKREG